MVLGTRCVRDMRIGGSPGSWFSLESLPHALHTQHTQRERCSGRVGKSGTTPCHFSGTRTCSERPLQHGQLLRLRRVPTCPPSPRSRRILKGTPCELRFLICLFVKPKAFYHEKPDFHFRSTGVLARAMQVLIECF